SSLVNAARLMGPAIAGLLIAAVGEGWCFFINGVSYVAILFSLLAMRLNRAHRKVQTVDLLHSLREGLRYVRSSVPIRLLLSALGIVSLLSSSYTVLLPIFAAQVLHGGPHTLGFLMAASGLGAMCGALLLASRRTVVGLGRIIG